MNIGLVLVGVGWNFMYIGATALLTETYQSPERARAHGIDESAMFATLALSSLFSGAFFYAAGLGAHQQAGSAVSSGGGV